MRDTSYQVSNQTKQKFSQGGEIKVMKKSLSLLIAIAMVFGMFASMASAAETELTAQQKYDALAAKGVFAGINGEAALDQDMTRAQFARVAALLTGLPGIGNPDTAVVTVAPFSDIKLGTWYIEEIDAVKTAEIFVGNADGTFGPSDNITVQQLAVVVAQILKLEPVADATVEGAADWAAGYIQALINNGIVLPTNYTANATRELLVISSYTAAEALNIIAPAKVSVTSAKASGVKTVTVVLDKAVDTEKATLSLKKGTTTVALDAPKWSEDKKTATLTLTSAKISEGTYTVTLAGVDADTIATATAQFTATAEVVSKIEFVTASDEIARSKNAQVKLRAENQYGELASFNASSYTANAVSLEKSLKKDEEGYLILTLDTSSTDLISGVSLIPIYVYFDETRVTAQKTFKVGTQVFVSNLELNDIKYNNGKEALTKSGESAELTIKLFDQYGNPVTPDQVAADNAGTPALNVSVNINTLITPHSVALDTAVKTDDDTYKVVISVKTGQVIEAVSTHTVTVYAGSSSKTATLNLSSSRVAANVKIGDIDGVVASGDTNIVVPLIVTDAEGNELTAQEIVDNEARINVSSSGGFTTGADIVELGKNKGKVLVAGANGAGSYGFLSASITTQSANSYDYKQFKVDAVRTPDSVALTVKPAVKAVRGAASDFDFNVRDQYGAKLNYAGNDYRVELTVTNVNGPATGNTVSATVYGDANTLAIAGGATVIYGETAVLGVESITDFNKGFKFDTNNGEIGTTRVVAALIKESTNVEISKATATIESISNATPLFYSLNAVTDLYAANDSGLLETAQKNTGSVVAKSIGLTVKDAAGNTVAYPNSFQTITAANPNFIIADVNGSNQAKILGNKAGTSTVTAVFAAADGTTKSLTTTVNTKSDIVTIKSMSAGTAEFDITSNPTVTDVSVIMDLAVTDQYGIKYEKANIYAYDKLTSVRYTVSDITGTGNVSVAFNGTDAYELSVDPTVTSFVLTAISRDGEVTASTIVTY
jgi:hypothetical protein